MAHQVAVVANILVFLRQVLPEVLWVEKAIWTGRNLTTGLNTTDSTIC